MFLHPSVICAVVLSLYCISPYYQGHTGAVNYLCWDPNGDYLASVSEDSVKVWSLASGDCIHELSSSGNPFHSCVFHPSYSALLVIGGMRVISLFFFTFFLLVGWGWVGCNVIYIYISFVSQLHGIKPVLVLSK